MRRGWLAVLVAMVGGFCIVLATPGAAVADPVPVLPGPVIEGSTQAELVTGVEAGAATAEGAAGAGMCATVIGCVFGVSMIAASTKSIWLPVLEKAFGFGSSSSGNGVCPSIVTAFTTTPEVNGFGVGGVFGTSGCTGNTISGNTSVDCIVTTTGAILFGQQSQAFFINKGSNVNVGKHCDGTSTAPEDVFSVNWTGGARQWVNPKYANFTPKSVTVHCIAPDGTTFDVTGASFQNGYAQVPSCSATTPGSHAVSVTIGTSDGTKTETITPKNDPAYADCALTSSLPVCTLAVWVDDVPCTVGAPRCVNWTKLVQGTATQAQRVACHWGRDGGPDYIVPMANCFLLERAYQDGGTCLDSGGLNVDGDPDTFVQCDPAGNPTSTQAAAPTAGALPTTGTNPGGVASPSPDVTSNGCTGLGWSWNPIDWVLTPVKCALEWAFVPSQSSINNFNNSINGTITGSALFGWFHVLSTWVGTLTGGGAGCQGPGIEWVRANDTTIHPFDACFGEMATIAGITRSFAEGLIILRGTLACLNAVASGFGWGLGLMRAKSAYDDHIAQSGAT